MPLDKIGWIYISIKMTGQIEYVDQDKYFKTGIAK